MNVLFAIFFLLISPSRTNKSLDQTENIITSTTWQFQSTWTTESLETIATSTETPTTSLNQTQDTIEEFLQEVSTLPPLCPESPGKIKNLAPPILNNFTVDLSWDPPDDECVTKYIVYLDDQEYATTTDQKFSMELNACVEYRIGVAVDYNNAIGDKVEIEVTLPTPNPFNYKVGDLQANIVDDMLNITWNPPPDSVVNCVTYYYLLWWSQNATTHDVKPEEPYYTITSIVGCMLYTFQVYPVALNGSLNGNTDQAEYGADGFPMNPPQFINDLTDKNSSTVVWQIDDFETNMCRLDSLVLTCEALAEENGDYFWIKKHSEAVQTLDNSTPRPTRVTVEIADLSPFTNYTCSSIVINSAGNSTVSDPIKLQTREEVPSEPKPIEITEVTHNSFKVKWGEPEMVPGILQSYTISITNIGPKHFVQDQCLDTANFTEVLDPETYEYSFSTASADYAYTVAVFGTDGAGDGLVAAESTITKTYTPEAPMDLNASETYIEDSLDYIASQEIMWLAPCNTNGPLKEFNMYIIGEYTEEGTFNPAQADSRNETINAHQDQTDIEYFLNITEIQASFLYNISIKAKLIDGTEGIEGTISFISPDGYPGPPILTELANETEASFMAYWEEPTIKYGKILHYNVTIESKGPLHQVPPECQIDTNTAVDQVDSVERIYSFSDGRPNYQYEAYVTAETKAGFGRNSETKSISTKEASPESVRNATITAEYSKTEEYHAVATLNFLPPCNTNGPFKNYEISYTERKEVTDAIKAVTNDTTFTIDLKPDHLYTVEVVVVAENFNTSTKLEDFHSEPGVPRLGVSLSPPSSNETNSAYFKLYKDAFDEANGAVLYYALFLLPKSEIIPGDSFGFWDASEDTWPPIPTGTGSGFTPYQITELFWNPFTETEVIDIVIGEEHNCSNNKYCNKQLKEDTEYSLIVRALTSATYKDTAPLHFKTEPLDELDLGLILGLTFGLLLFIILIIFIVFLLWRRRKRKNFIEEEVVRTSISTPTSIDCKRFPSYYDSLIENYNILKAQYTTLTTKSKDVALPVTYAVLPENKRKNRYTNILPYDETRVKLKIDEDDEIGSDYINASYIRGYSGSVEYIATQGPLQSTCKDFWKMILQENVMLIVMVSQFIEQSKEKCYQYFPNNHETLDLGENFEIQCMTELHFGIYCVRTLQIKKDTIRRNVVHMQFLEWPDFGVPQGTDNMLQFCQQMRERARAEGGLIVVHCSAGVGRTGTLIATDMLLQTINDHRDINIFEIVLDLRRQRTNMVQTEKQYMFIHTCVKDTLEGPSIRADEVKSEPIYENMSILKSSLKENLIAAESESAL